jgi:hypothetical protein
MKITDLHSPHSLIVVLKLRHKFYVKLYIKFIMTSK